MVSTLNQRVNPRSIPRSDCSLAIHVESTRLRGFSLIVQIITSEIVGVSWHNLYLNRWTFLDADISSIYKIIKGDCNWTTVEYAPSGRHSSDFYTVHTRSPSDSIFFLYFSNVQSLHPFPSSDKTTTSRICWNSPSPRPHSKWLPNAKSDYHFISSTCTMSRFEQKARKKGEEKRITNNLLASNAIRCRKSKQKKQQNNRKSEWIVVIGPKCAQKILGGIVMGIWCAVSIRCHFFSSACSP